MKFWPGDLTAFYNTIPAVVVLCDSDYYDSADDEVSVLRCQVTMPRLALGFWEKWRDATVRESTLIARPKS